MGYGNRGNSGFGGGNGGGGRGFEPKPGQGTLFIKNDKRTQQAPDYDGYFIFDRDIQAGEKVKLVGWDKSGRTGNMITLKLGRDRQDAPGYNEGGHGGQGGWGNNQPPQGGYQPMQGGQGNGYRPGPQQGGYQPPPQNYGPRGGYQPPQNPPAGAYQGGGYGGQPAQTYQPPAAGSTPAPGGAGPLPMQPTYPAPPPEDDLPF